MLDSVRVVFKLKIPKERKKDAYITRDRILKMLSDDEVSNVGTAESAVHLSDPEKNRERERPILL